MTTAFFSRHAIAITILAPIAALLPGCDRKPAVAPIDPKTYATAAPPSASQPAAAALLPRFTDVTQAAGLTFRHYNGAAGKIWMPETLGSGAAFFDYDADGDCDILLVNSCDWPGGPADRPQPTPELYRNDGQGGFENITAAAGLDRFSLYGMGVSAADFDADGDADLLITGVGRSLLLRNDDGRYSDVSETNLLRDPGSTPPGSVPDWSLSSAWLDYDADGDLDLFICNYVSWTPETDVYTTLDGRHKSYATPEVYRGQTSRLFRNRGEGVLEEVTRAAGVLNPSGKSMGVIVEDFNDDGRPDLFITNDKEANFLYLNRGGSFQEIALAAGCGYDEAGRARAGMGVCSADLTNGGDLCIAIGNFSREPVSLYRRVKAGDDLLFVDAAAKARLATPTLLMLTFGAAFADFNLDGFLDLALANGHIEPTISSIQQEITFAQAPQLFLNAPLPSGEGRALEDATSAVGADFAKPMVGRGLAFADIDLDGDLDLLITGNNGPPRLLRNDLPDAGARAIRLALRGEPRNPDAIGAVVRARTSAGLLRRPVRTGGSYLSQSELAVTLGVPAEGAADVEVTWADGRIEKLGALRAGASYTVQYGKGVISQRAFSVR